MVIKVTQLCVCGGEFAVATRGSRIFTFEVESPEPLSTIQNENVCFGMVLHEEELVIWDGSFAIKKYRGNRLVPVDHAASTASQLIEDRDNNFSSIYSNTGYEKRDNQEFHVQRIGNQELFNGPSHVLPKPSLIVGKFLKGLLSVRTKTITPTQNVEMQVDHDSEPIVEKWKPKKDVGPLDLDFLDSYFAQTVI